MNTILPLRIKYTAFPILSNVWNHTWNIVDPKSGAVTQFYLSFYFYYNVYVGGRVQSICEFHELFVMLSNRILSKLCLGNEKCIKVTPT